VKRLAAIFVFVLALSAAPSALAAGPFAWGPRALVDPPDGAHALRAVSCTTPHFCASVDDAGNAVRSNNPTGGAAAWKLENIDGSNHLRAISCVPSLCVAGDQVGNVLTLSNPANLASAWSSPAAIDSGNIIIGLSCPTAALCVAVDNAGQVLTSTNPTGGASKWSSPALIDSGNILTAVSCPSTGFCAAVDNKGNSLTSTNPTGGAAAWTLHSAIDGTNDLEGISCPSASLCVAIRQTDFTETILTSTAPTVNGPWKSRKVEPANQFFTLFGISCPSKTLCVAADDNGDVLTSTNPTGGAAAWTRTPVDARWSFYAMSCSTLPLCAGVDQGGNVEVGHLLVPGTVLTGATIKPKLHKASFSFKANGIASGFQCELKHDKPGAKGSFSTCRSPKGYKNLKAGKYIFLVRAVNYSGADKTPAVKRFKI